MGVPRQNNTLDQLFLYPHAFAHRILYGQLTGSCNFFKAVHIELDTVYPLCGSIHLFDEHYHQTTFLMSIIIRLYWSLVGNEYANMLKWIPFTRERIKTLFNDIKHHLVLDVKATYRIGHTALGSFVFFILQLFSGFAMYSVKHPGEYWSVIGELVQNTITVDDVKRYHKMLMYIVLVFFPIHLFMSWLNHIKLKNELIGSIFNGHKIIHEKNQKSPAPK
jgi:Ni,Fe-hydrogenase I cytochrome b subunit